MGRKVTYATMLLLALNFLALSFAGVQHRSRNTPQTINDTVIVYDTIKIRHPIAVDSLVVRYKTVKLPIADTIRVVVSDTLIRDSIVVDLPIEQKEYSDSTYHAWISGFHPSLDSIEVYNKTVRVEPTTVVSHKRWNLGVQAGVGYTPGSNTVSPYIGVGVSYSIFAWQ